MKPNIPWRFAIFLGVAPLAAGGWWISEERVAGLKAENARLSALVNEDRLIGTIRARTRLVVEEVEDAAPVAPVVVKESVGEDGDVLVSSEALDALEGQLAEVLSPLEEEGVASSMVNAAVRHGETLVTGGHQDANGNFVFTLATPTAMEFDDGEEGVQFAFQEVAVPADRVSVLGLDTIAAGARNTPQHGERWTSQEADAVMERILAGPERVSMTSPMIAAREGQQASIQIGEPDRTRRISVNAEALPDASGYAPRMRVEDRQGQGVIEGDSVSE